MNPTPVSRENKCDGRTGADGHTGAFAKCASVFMPQMRAQHVAFAVLAVRLKLPVFTSSALAFEAALVRHRWTC